MTSPRVASRQALALMRRLAAHDRLLAKTERAQGVSHSERPAPRVTYSVSRALALSAVAQPVKAEDARSWTSIRYCCASDASRARSRCA